MQLRSLGEIVCLSRTPKPTFSFPLPPQKMETAIAEKMKSAAAKQPSSLACIKFWVVVISTMLLILWVCAMQLATLDDKTMVPKSAFYFPYSFPPQRIYKSNGYLIISPNGGLHQKRLGISDMVVIARYWNVTLIVTKFAHGTDMNDTW